MATPAAKFDPSDYEDVGDLGARVLTPGSVSLAGQGTPAEQEATRQGARDKPGEAAALTRGLAQGVSLGFADEIAGAAENVATGKPYTKGRDESRAAYNRAAALQPMYYAAGLGGSALLPIPGGGGATVARSILKAGALGGAAGLGASEADLTRGEYGKAAVDTGIGAGTAAGLSGLISWRLQGAEKRQLADLVQDVNRGTTSANRKGRLSLSVKAGGDDYVELAALRDRYPGPIKTIGAVAKPHPEEGAKVTNALVSKLNEQNAPVYQTINGKLVGITPNDILSDVAKARAALGGKMYERKALDAWTNEFTRQYGVDGVIPSVAKQRIPAEEVRQIATDAGNVAFAGDPTAPKNVKQAASEAIRRAIVGRIEKEATKAGVTPEAIAALKQNNKDMSLLITMRDNMAQRAADQSGGGQALTGMLEKLKSAGVTGTVKEGVKAAAGFAGRQSDRLAAPIGRAAQRGGIAGAAARGVRGVAEIGIPRVAGEVAAGAVSRATASKPKFDPSEYED